MMLLQRPRVNVARSSATSSRRPVVKACATAQTVTVVRETVTAAEEAPVELDVEAMQRRLEARAKALIQLDEQEAAQRTAVKFVLKQKVGLGEAWKICGKVPELGRMVPEVAPYMKWNAGDVWTLELKVRPGPTTYKAVLRKADGAYLWETGKDRVFEARQVPHGPGAKEVAIENVKFV